MNEVPVAEKSKDEKEKRKRRILFWIFVAIILALLFILLNRSSDPANPVEDAKPRPGIGQVIDGDLPNMTDEQIKDALKKNQDASMFTLAVDSQSTYEKGSKILYLMVGNSDKNSLDCFFEIIDNGEVIYTSPQMKPKQYIKTAELSRELTEGTNKLIVRYYVSYQDTIIGNPEAKVYVVTKR